MGGRRRHHPEDRSQRNDGRGLARRRGAVRLRDHGHTDDGRPAGRPCVARAAIRHERHLRPGERVLGCHREREDRLGAGQSS
ncbi:hypothetical protein ACFPRL_17870 [Pseudoclavibacter helvolus]